MYIPGNFGAFVVPLSQEDYQKIMNHPIGETPLVLGLGGKTYIHNYL